MMNLVEKEIKHKKTCTPFECAHCGLIWYGWTGIHADAQGQVLCTKCWSAFDNYMWEKHRHADRGQSVQDDARAWIEDKSKKPYPLPRERRFHRSVPKWMRSALEAGMVAPNDEKTYVVYSVAQIATRTEQVNK